MKSVSGGGGRRKSVMMVSSGIFWSTKVLCLRQLTNHYHQTSNSIMKVCIFSLTILFFIYLLWYKISQFSVFLKYCFVIYSPKLKREKVFLCDVLQIWEEPWIIKCRNYVEHLGKEMLLSSEAEEVATFYAKMLDHDYTTREIFNENFFRDWRKVSSVYSNK